MSDIYQMTIVGPYPDEEIARKGLREEILAQEQEFIEDYKRQGFEIRKHVMGFSARHPGRAVHVSCEIRKVSA